MSEGGAIPARSEMVIEGKIQTKEEWYFTGWHDIS
jgi:3-polyprenyl-4-hydroxybenzoate decarboxylase